MKLSTKTVIFISIAFAILLFLVITGNKSGRITQKTTPAPAVQKTAVLSFNPAVLAVGKQKTYQADIVVDAGSNPISGVQVHISYDPKIIANASLLPPLPSDSFFGSENERVVLFNKNDEQKGDLFYAIALQPNIPTKNGKGKIATLKFTVAPAASFKETKISFINNTLVTKEGQEQSVLKQAASLVLTPASQ